MKYPWIDEYLLQKPAVQKDFKEEWGWYRYQIGGKLFAAVCLDEAGKPYYITLKLEPADGDFYRRQYPDVLPGYYMNKVHWNSIRADGEVPDAVLRDFAFLQQKEAGRAAGRGGRPCLKSPWMF